MKKIASSPDIKLLPVFGPAYFKDRIQRQETRVSIHENNDTPTIIDMDKKHIKIPWWKRNKEEE